METYTTEEDQIRAIRQWWERNGSSTLIGIGLALAIVFGWQWWQERNRTGVEQSSMLYQQLLQASDGAGADAVKRATAEHLAGELMNAQSGSRYADYAALLLARLKVESGDLAAAETQLRLLLEAQPDQPASLWQDWLDQLLGQDSDAQIGALARVRLARVQFALGRPDDALATIEAAGNEDFTIEKLELRGDIMRGRGDMKQALQHYSEALAIASSAPGAGASRLLELKIQELELLGQNAALAGDKS